MVYRVLQKKNSHPVKLIAKKLPCPLSPNSMLLPRFAWKDLPKKQPCRFGCQHALGNNIDQGGAGGSGVMWQHVGGWLLKKKHLFFLVYGCANTKLEQIPFCICQHVNPNTLSSSKLLPSKQRSNRFCFIWFMDVQTEAWTNSLLQVPKPQSKHTFIFTTATHKQRNNIAAFAPTVSKNWRSEAVCLAWWTNVECASTPPEVELQHSGNKHIRGHKHPVLHSARTVHAQHATVRATVRSHKML